MCIPRFVDCDNKGDDRGVTLSYNYNLAEATDGYGGDYDNQISSCKTFQRLRQRAEFIAYTHNREMLKSRNTCATFEAESERRALIF